MYLFVGVVKSHDYNQLTALTTIKNNDDDAIEHTQVDTRWETIKINKLIAEIIFLFHFKL